MATIPDPSLLTPERIAVVLRGIRFPMPPDHRPWVAEVASCCPAIREVPRAPVPTWTVAEHRVRRQAAPRASAATLICSCGGTGCVHAAAVAALLALREPGRRRALTAPAWEVALAPLVPRPTPPRARHLGRIRYEIRPPSPGTRALIVVPTVIRHGEGGAALKPLRYPRTIEALRAAATGITPADLEIHPAWHALERARRLEKGKQGAATRHLSRVLLVALSRAGELWLGHRRIDASAEPIAPRIHAVRKTDGELALSWAPALVLHWRQAGIVLTAEGVLAPLIDDLPEAVADRLTDPLPPIPAEQITRFVDQLVVAGGLDVQLPPDLPTVHPPDDRCARICLIERPGHRLEIRLELVYTRRTGQVVLSAEPWAPVALVPGEGQVRRDQAWEVAEAQRFATDLGQRSALELPFADALTFLEVRLPQLAADWEIYGQDGLIRLRNRGTLQPRLQFTEGEDWFELDVAFALGEQQIDGAQVIEDWLQGRRYHRLSDGTLAALPQRWLARHGARVDALLEVRRAQRRMGSWHAWMCSELLALVGDPAEAWLGWVRRASADEGVPQLTPPESLAAQLRPYQRQGLSWLAFLAEHRLHGVLADEMGLGKTVQTLAALLHVHRSPSGAEHPSLVVAPTSVVHGWCDEAARFAPDLSVVLWHGAQRDPGALEGAELVVTTYALLRRDQGTLLRRRWTYAVLDEAQAIKNPGSQTARAARRLRARHRLALTGTPLQNDLIELWSLFAFLMPGYLGRRTTFHARYAAASPQATADLAHRIRPFLLRRRKEQVAPELPRRTELTVSVPLSGRERSLYDSVRLTVLTAMSAAEDDAQRRRDLLLDGLTRLRQAACHPGLLPFPEAQALPRSSKVEALIEQLQRVIAAGSRALVFSQWVQLLDRVAARLDRARIGYVRLQGNTRDRPAVVAAFQADDGPPVFLISRGAGGTGLNLTAADVVYHLDPWWNPAVEDQATDRAHRIGQRRPVTVVRLVAADTVESRILELQSHKRRLFAQTVERSPLDVATLSLDDLRALLE